VFFFKKIKDQILMVSSKESMHWETASVKHSLGSGRPLGTTLLRAVPA